MELLGTLIAIGAVVLLCGGMHFLMMRGMHRGQASHSEAEDADRITQLEGQVSKLEQELYASRGADPRPVTMTNGHAVHGRAGKAR